MENKKITLEDLKLESFLTEIDNSKLIKIQGGNGEYGDSEGGCDSEIDACTTDDDVTASGCTCDEYCVPQSEIICQTETEGSCDDCTTDEPQETYYDCK